MERRPEEGEHLRRKLCRPNQRAERRTERAAGGKARRQDTPAPCFLGGRAIGFPGDPDSVQQTSFHTVWKLLHGESWVVWGQGTGRYRGDLPEVAVMHLSTTATLRLLSEGGRLARAAPSYAAQQLLGGLPPSFDV